MTRPPIGSLHWHEPTRQWVTVAAPGGRALDEDEVRVVFVNLPTSEMVVKVASLREQP